jgi:hypothetical protein
VPLPKGKVDAASWREACDEGGVVSYYDYGLRA